MSSRRRTSAVKRSAAAAAAVAAVVLVAGCFDDGQPEASHVPAAEAGSLEPNSPVHPTAAPRPVARADEVRPSPLPPDPVGGLTARQMEHAATIVGVGEDLGLPRRALVVALATARQESQLRVLANPAVPESSKQPHDAKGSDHDSVGIFQQRPSMGWGTVAECMDPRESARRFFLALQQVDGWQQMSVTAAAQAVQKSAYPDHYAQHEDLARQLVAVLVQS